MGKHLCFETTFPSRSLFGKVLSLDWYDGTTSGLVQCSRCPAVFKYDIVDWDSDQERRMFAFSPIAPQEFDQVVSVFSRTQEPTWPFWSPKWQLTSPDSQIIKAEINEHLAHAKTPEYLVAGDRGLETVFAAKQLTGPARDRLPLEFGGLPVTDDFGYWKKYIGLHD